MITYDKIYALNVRDDKDINFAKLLCTGEKKIETRNTNILKKHIGERIRINRTGIKGEKSQIIGELTISGVVHYKTDKDFDKHLVDKNSKYHLKNSKYNEKFGYVIENPTLYEKSYFIEGKSGIVVTKNQGYNP